MLSELNQEQYTAATTFNGPLLVLAGAGSGKTKTIVTRTANMILNGINPQSILVMTFTNKAAKEMKERGINLLRKYNYKGKIPEYTTFHSWGFKFLKLYIKSYNSFDNLKNGFTIIDEYNQKQIIKPLIEKYILDYKSKGFKTDNFLSILTFLQNNIISYSSFEESIRDLNEVLSENNRIADVFEDNHIISVKDLNNILNIYIEYNHMLRINQLVDFDDLINLPIQILETNPNMRDYLHSRYNYIMVDEFQDTNKAQIRLLDLMLNHNNNICVVGDDSQSIYGWRGADINYILSFDEKFEQVKKINLKINYRSTKSIVENANKLIDKAKEKHKAKEKLVPFKKSNGETIVKQFFSIDEESTYIAKEINKLLSQNSQEIAILYRAHFLVSPIEKELIKNKIPYTIYKGKAILEKKVAIEYLSLFHLLLNRDNNIAFETFLLSEAKVISQKKLLEIKNQKPKNINLFTFIKENKEHLSITKKTLEILNNFYFHFEELLKMNEEKEDIGEILFYFRENLLYVKSIEIKLNKTKSEATTKKLEKALEDIFLIESIIVDYESINQFMEVISLDKDIEQKDIQKVVLMTIHGSKGLEFENVFLPRFNQGIIPAGASLDSFKKLEEERRLAYVAFTRAKEKLYITYPLNAFGQNVFPSQFLYETNLIKANKRIWS